MSRSERAAGERWERYVKFYPLYDAFFKIEFVDLVSSKIGRVKLGVQQRIESTIVALYTEYCSRA